LEAKGQSISIRDAMVGAIALTRGCTLVTRNIVHFQKIEGLNLMRAP